jgi:two-component system response regulator HydG
MNTKIRILVVDDEPDICFLVKAVLDSPEFSIETTTKSVEALDWLSKREFDLVITDRDMEGVKGEELVAKARETNPATKTIMMSGLMEVHESTLRGVQRPDMCIQKPFTVDVILDAVKSILENAKSALAA